MTKLTVKPINVLAMDPGTKNYAWAMVCFAPNKKPKILRCEMLLDTISDVKDGAFDIMRRKFRRFWRKLLLEYRPAKVVIERFINRGRFFGGLAELVGIMIGILSEICHKLHIPLIPVTAAAWKNNFQRQTKLKLPEVYKQLKPLLPHQIDSGLIALYGYNKVNTYVGWTPKYFKRAVKWAKLTSKK